MNAFSERSKEFIYRAKDCILNSTFKRINRLNPNILNPVIQKHCLALFCLVGIFSQAQFLDLNRSKPYYKVFEETDVFGEDYLAQLEEAYTKVENDSLRFSMLNDLAYYWHTRNLNTSLKFTKEGLNATQIKKNTLWYGRFQITHGALLLRMEKLDSARLVLEEAKKKVLERDLSFLNTQMGYVFERRGELDKAADHAMESLRLGEKLNDTKAKAMAYSDLSNLFWKQSKYGKGLEYGLRSLRLFEERGIEDLDYDFTLYVVGNNYLGYGAPSEALQKYEQAIEIGERYGFYNNLSDIYISLVDLYIHFKENEKAKKAAFDAIKYAELLENNFMLMRSWSSLGKVYNELDEYTNAIDALKKSLTIATDDFGDKFFLSAVYEQLGMAYKEIGDYKSSLDAFMEYDSLKQQVFTAEADHRTATIHTQFDVAQKENQILIQEAEIKKQRTWRTLLTIILGLSFLILALGYLSIKNNRRKKQLLEKQNEEKEFLLKEIHHRVKNNLEMVSSLLALQSAKITDANVLDAIQKSQNRVHSMGLIHQRLYKGNNLSSIEMRDYFLNLGKYVVEAFSVSDNVQVESPMEELELDIDMAIPIGLIVNELLTNSMKHAFPNNATGSISISLVQEQDFLILQVSDNGVGFDIRKEDSGFGNQLIQLLAKQLDGTLEKETNQGTKVSLRFKKYKAA